jgi:hypothetical protein
MDGNEVTAAFEMLLAELEPVRQHLKQEAATVFALVREGLMRSDSPRGIWEISDAGRKAVETEQWPA